MKNQLNLPSGLIDDHSEFFGGQTNIHRLASGNVIKSQELHRPFYELLVKEIATNKAVGKCLDNLDLKTEEQRVLQYYQCNYSVFDNNPDLIDDKTLGEREYVMCPLREKCPHEGVLCVLPFGLTPREGHVLKRIALGLLDKEICPQLFMSPSNLRYYKDNISIKTNTNRKPALVRIALQIGLI